MFRSMKGLSHVHFVGIGGAGMSGIAEVLLDYDLEVSGCDAGRGEAIARLESLGVKVYQGHSPDHLDGVDLVVKSSAVTDDNEEIRAARARGITVVRRAEMLGELMRMKYGIAVAGTHGKTTTTSLISTLLVDAGLDPTVIVGGRMRVSGTGARVGKSDYLVAEADEFDRSFLRLMPILAIVTSIDVDHLDTYGNYEAIEQAFVEFASRVPFFGQIIVCLDDPNIQKILPRLTHSHRVVTYGLSPQADLSAQNLELSPDGCRFTVLHATEGPLGEVHTPLAGRHNVRNVLAAVAVGRNLQLSMDQIATSLAGFRGVHRRFERLGEYAGAVVIDDYAHHPTEVAATLQAARQTFPRGRIHAIFQPHLFSRTRDLAAEFGRSLMEADETLVTAIYASRESPIPGVSGEAIVMAARASGHRQVEYVADRLELPAILAAKVAAGRLGPGDLVLTLGAGDIYQLSHHLVAAALAGKKDEGEGE
jgi:UDP-N-acetylmuramate--alanine ligase